MTEPTPQTEADQHRAFYGDNWYAELRGPDGVAYAALEPTADGVLRDLRDRASRAGDIEAQARTEALDVEANAVRLLRYLWSEAAVEGPVDVGHVRDLFQPTDPLYEDIEDALAAKETP